MVGQRLDRLGLLGGIYVVYAYRIHIGRFSPLDAVQNIFKYGAVLGSYPQPFCREKVNIGKSLASGAFPHMGNRVEQMVNAVVF